MFASLIAITTKRVLLILPVVFIMIIGALSGPGCANIIPPSGGPEDSIPPVLEKSDPPDSTLNFHGNKISFDFDEYLAPLQNVQQEILISPTPRVFPTIEAKLSTLTIRFRDTLDANTTYTIQFGNAVKDLNENNILKNFTHTFSTGPYIDSLEFRGKVLLAETGKVDSSLVVILHTNPNDSAVVNEKPRYSARVDSKGNFIFRNLPPRTFYVYALKDESNTFRYFNDKQLFAFADKPVTISDSVAPVLLYAYATTPPSTMPLGSTSGTRLRAAATNDKRLKYTTTVINNQQDLLNRFEMNFDLPLRTLDTSKMRLYTDSAFNPVSAYQFILDTSERKLAMVYDLKPQTFYRLILDKDFAEDSAGRKLIRTDTINFTTKKLADYGLFRLRIKNLDLTKNPVLLFVVNNAVTRTIPMTTNEITVPLFLPGEYEVRLLYDQNKNGKWDPGEFFGTKKQPELVVPIQRKFNVRANWENEFEISL